MGDKDAQEKVVLGIHSRVGPDPGNSAGRFMDGHAWLSLTANGQTEYYGLWPDGHPLLRTTVQKATSAPDLKRRSGLRQVGTTSCLHNSCKNSRRN